MSMLRKLTDYDFMSSVKAWRHSDVGKGDRRDHTYTSMEMAPSWVNIWVSLREV